MPIYRPTPIVPNRQGAIMHAFPGSTVATAAVTPAPQLPNPPSAPLLAASPGSDLTVTWSAPLTDASHDAATGFNLQFSPAGAGNWTVVTGVSSPYDLSGLAAGTGFDVEVQSVNAAGTSAWSATTTLTTAAAAPNAPSVVSLAPGNGSDLTVIWTAPTVDSTHNAATGFNLRSSPSGAANWTTVTNVVSPYDLSGLAAGAAIDVQIQALNAMGTSAWSATSTATTAAGGPLAPNVPVITSVAPPPDGTATKLTITWTAPAADSAHGAATGFNLRFSPSGAGTWTVMSGVTSPYTLIGLNGATAIDVEVQAVNAAAVAGAWSAVTTGTTWGTIVVPGGLTAAATQVHGTSVAPAGGVNLVSTPAPTAATGAAFAWSTSQTTVPTSGLTAAGPSNVLNGWGAYMSAPATAGTFYLWMLTQGANGATSGALVSSAITVT